MANHPFLQYPALFNKNSKAAKIFYRQHFIEMTITVRAACRVVIWHFSVSSGSWMLEKETFPKDGGDHHWRTGKPLNDIFWHIIWCFAFVVNDKRLKETNGKSKVCRILAHPRQQPNEDNKTRERHLAVLLFHFITPLLMLKVPTVPSYRPL